MRTSKTEEISTTEHPNLCSVFRLCFFSSSSSFSFFYVFSLLFSEAWSRNTNKDLFVQNEEHALQTRAKFPDYGGSGL
jgi:hypothetical protein